MTKIVKTAMQAERNPGGGPPNPEARGGPKATKGGGKGGKSGKNQPKAPPVKQAIGKKKLTDTIHKLAVQGGKCARFNKTGCDNPDCGFPHECAVCTKPGCAAWKHPELAEA